MGNPMDNERDARIARVRPSVYSFRVWDLRLEG